MAYWLGIPVGENLEGLTSQQLLDKATHGMTTNGFLPLDPPNVIPNPFELFSESTGQLLTDLYADLGVRIVCIAVTLDVQSTGQVF